jgi:hypothetical protein
MYWAYRICPCNLRFRNLRDANDLTYQVKHRRKERYHAQHTKI